jgi:RNA polymerase sigma-B factor
LLGLQAANGAIVMPMEQPRRFRSGEGTGADDALTALHRAFAATGDGRLREELTVAYTDLALGLVQRFRSRRETREDLAQVAMIGLLHAVDRFDPERGTPFEAFAAVAITGELKRHVRDRTWLMRVPRYLKEGYLQVIRAADELTQSQGRSPTVPEISEYTGLSNEEVLEAMEVGHFQKPLSLDAPAEEGDDTLGNKVGGADAGFTAVERQDYLNALLARLPDRELRVLRLRFEDDLTQAEIAARLGVSQMQVSRLLARALTRLRIWSEDQ